MSTAYVSGRVPAHYERLVALGLAQPNGLSSKIAVSVYRLYDNIESYSPDTTDCD